MEHDPEASPPPVGTEEAWRDAGTSTDPTPDALGASDAGPEPPDGVGAPEPPDSVGDLEPPDSAGDGEAPDSVGGGEAPEDIADTPCSGVALHLDGSAYALLPRLIQDDFTLEAWIRTTESLPGVHHFDGRGLIDADVIGPHADFGTGIVSDRFVFGVANDTTISSTSVLTTGVWTHVAATRQARTGDVKVFVNGELEAAAVSPTRSALSDPLVIALGGTQASRRFIGEIDEVRLWSIVRDAGELRQTLRASLSGNEEGLVGYFTFEDRGTTTTADSSRSGFPAALVGAVQYVPSRARCPEP